MQVQWIFTGVVLAAPSCIIGNGLLVVSNDGKIAYAGPEDGFTRQDCKHIDLRGRLLVPGFIDLHHHGGDGISFEAGADPQQMAEHAAWAARNGVTGYLRTIAAPTQPELLALIGAHVDQMKGASGGARPLGLHLEGPFLNPDKAGAFNPGWLRAPDAGEIRAWLETGEGWIKMVTLSPELPGAFESAHLLLQAGVVAAMGHTTADYGTVARALAGDFSHSTHTFNAQSGFTHRDPGAVGAVLASDTATAEVIADGVHVHPAALKILVRCLAHERVVLVTDSMPAAGLPDGEYSLVGQQVTVQGGTARLADGTLAGSTATMPHCVRTMHRDADVPLYQALQMASLNPARVIGADKVTGSLQPGKTADLVVIDDDVNVYLTMVNGEIVYNRLF